jgi:hypothetical protein
VRRATSFSIVLVLAGGLLFARQSTRPPAPRLWTAAALDGWALPIAGVNATPNFYTEAEYYTAPVDEVRTYPVYAKSREPQGYRDWMRSQGRRPLIEPEKLHTEADWIAAGREVFDGMHLAEFRTADPRAFEWADDPEPGAHGVSVASDGTIPGVRWLVDHDSRLKLTLTECSACHSRLLPDGSVAHGAQSILRLGSFPPICFEEFSKIDEREGRKRPPNESAYSSYGVPWRRDDINARLKTMSADEIRRVDGDQPHPGTFIRFNASPWYTTKIADLIGVKDRKYLDATATHRNRGPDDIARYAILVTTADDGSVGPHKFIPEKHRALRWRNSDEALIALGKYIYSLEPPPNPNRPTDETRRGEAVFGRAGCATCHTPPLYTNNKLVAVEGFARTGHRNSPPAADVMNVRIGLDSGLALRTRKGTGYYKVPSLKGVWYRGPLEHSGSVLALEDWFDANRLNDSYVPTGWNPPDARTRAISGHRFGLTLSDDDKKALIAFLRTL